MRDEKKLEVAVKSLNMNHLFKYFGSPWRESMWSDPNSTAGFYIGTYVYSLLMRTINRTFDDHMPPLDIPIHNGRIGYPIRTGGHNLIEYDWHRYMYFVDEHWKEK